MTVDMWIWCPRMSRGSEDEIVMPELLSWTAGLIQDLRFF